MRLLLDADATLALRKLSLWTEILGSNVEVHFTGYVARHELSSIWTSELQQLEGCGRVTVHDVKARTPAWEKKRALQTAGADKGEAEAIAWGTQSEEPRPVFVSVDARARQHAAANGLRTIDVGELAAHLVLDGILSQDVVSEKLSVWDDAAQQQGRPNGWRSLAHYVDMLRGRQHTT